MSGGAGWGGWGGWTIWTLAKREVVRFLRQPSRVLGAAGSPLIFWILIGSGFSGSFRMPGAGDLSFREYFFPGTVALVLLFAAIFSTISVIEDRREGFLQGVLVAPVPRAAIVAGKILGGATIAWLQAALFLALAPATGIALSLRSAALTLAVLALLAVALTALGFAFAWNVDSVQGFHAVMNLVLVPMWLLSGSFFPLAGVSPWLGVLMRINPMTYGVDALRGAIYGSTLPHPGLPGPAQALAMVGALAAIAFAGALLATRARGTK